MCFICVYPPSQFILISPSLYACPIISSIAPTEKWLSFFCIIVVLCVFCYYFLSILILVIIFFITFCCTGSCILFYLLLGLGFLIVFFKLLIVITFILGSLLLCDFGYPECLFECGLRKEEKRGLMFRGMIIGLFAFFLVAFEYFFIIKHFFITVNRVLFYS